MNVLFLTMGRFESIEAHSIYADLLRCFRNHGHSVYTICPNEKRYHKKTEIIEENGCHILRIETGDVTRTSSLIKKGIAQTTIEPIYIRAIKEYFPDIQFDLVLYSTPPITFCKAIEYVKKRDGARSYLLLKDIFPQNAVDLGMMSKTGPKSFIYRFFRAKEKKLYALSDRIGCMSQANVDYVLKHNPEVPAEKVEICPNAIEVQDVSITEEEKFAIRNKYGIPLDKKVFVYGGNLGRPQGIPFMIECLRACKDTGAFFLIVGSGTEYGKIQNYVDSERPEHVKLMQSLPKEDYDRMIAACDVGLIFLDHRFTIPNFPSRLLSYMQAGLPVLACTDPNTDIGKVIVEGSFGWWCESDDTDAFSESVNAALNCEPIREQEFEYLIGHYTVEASFQTIIKN